jgi:hypothetical protein
MDNATFWKIIDATRQAAQGDPYEHVNTLQEALGELEAQEIVDFDRIFREHRARAYTWGLWGAAYVIGGGCSDDSFMDFRAWLISKGEAAYDEALKNPDSLVDVVTEQDGDAQVESLNYAASQAWEKKLNKSFQEFPYHEVDQPSEPNGDPWDEDEDELAQRFPNLYKKFNE